MKDGLVIRPAGQYSTITEVNEARANAFPGDYGMTTTYEDAIFDGAKAPEVYVDLVADGLDLVATAEATEEARGLVDISTASWDFGDATAAVTGEMRVEHTYAAAGTYTVTFTVEDADGDIVTITDDITVG